MDNDGLADQRGTGAGHGRCVQIDVAVKDTMVRELCFRVEQRSEEYQT